MRNGVESKNRKRSFMTRLLHFELEPPDRRRHAEEGGGHQKDDRSCRGGRQSARASQCCFRIHCHNCVDVGKEIMKLSYYCETLGLENTKGQ